MHKSCNKKQAGFEGRRVRPQDFVGAEDIAKIRIADESFLLYRKP